MTFLTVFRILEGIIILKRGGRGRSPSKTFSNGETEEAVSTLNIEPSFNVFQMIYWKSKIYRTREKSGVLIDYRWKGRCRTVCQTSQAEKKRKKYDKCHFNNDEFELCLFEIHRLIDIFLIICYFICCFCFFIYIYLFSFLYLPSFMLIYLNRLMEIDFHGNRD